MSATGDRVQEALESGEERGADTFLITGYARERCLADLARLEAVADAARNTLHYVNGRAVLRHDPSIDCPLCAALRALDEEPT